MTVRRIEKALERVSASTVLPGALPPLVCLLKREQFVGEAHADCQLFAAATLLLRNGASPHWQHPHSAAMGSVALYALSHDCNRVEALEVAASIGCLVGDCS